MHDIRTKLNRYLFIDAYNQYTYILYTNTMQNESRQTCMKIMFLSASSQEVMRPLTLPLLGLDHTSLCGITADVPPKFN